MLRALRKRKPQEKRLRWQAANHGCHCFDRAFLSASACVCCVKISLPRPSAATAWDTVLTVTLLMSVYMCQVMLGGAWFRECFGDVDCCDVDYIVDTAINVVARHLRIRDEPAAVIPHILKVR